MVFSNNSNDVKTFTITDCYRMPSLPQGAFAACKLRAQNQKTLQVATNTPEKPEPAKIFNANKKLMDYSPVKYNEKFMNAIWGHYNRYSPHNIKSNDAASAASGNSATFQKQEVTILPHWPLHTYASFVVLLYLVEIRLVLSV